MDETTENRCPARTSDTPDGTVQCTISSSTVHNMHQSGPHMWSDETTDRCPARYYRHGLMEQCHYPSGHTGAHRSESYDWSNAAYCAADAGEGACVRKAGHKGEHAWRLVTAQALDRGDAWKPVKGPCGQTFTGPDGYAATCNVIAGHIGGHQHLPVGSLYDTAAEDRLRDAAAKAGRVADLLVTLCEAVSPSRERCELASGHPEVHTWERLEGHTYREDKPDFPPALVQCGVLFRTGSFMSECNLPPDHGGRHCGEPEESAGTDDAPMVWERHMKALERLCGPKDEPEPEGYARATEINEALTALEQRVMAALGEVERRMTTLEGRFGRLAESVGQIRSVAPAPETVCGAAARPRGIDEPAVFCERSPGHQGWHRVGAPGDGGYVTWAPDSPAAVPETASGQCTATLRLFHDLAYRCVLDAGHDGRHTDDYGDHWEITYD